MEPHKLRCLENFLYNSRTNMDLNDYLQIIRDKETQIRESYAEPIPLLSDEFIRMVLVDSAFIIQLFRHQVPGLKSLHSGLFYTDLRLAENQLPFFILKDLYKYAFDNSYFTDFVCSFLDIEKSRIKVDNTTNEAECFHLLDLLRTSYFPTHNQLIATVKKDDWGRISCHTATSLYEAGVKFHVDHSPNSSLLDIRFDMEKGILAIPKLMFGDETESMFRNLLAFEQCHYSMYGNRTYLADYLCFWDELINTAEDVKLLVTAGIVGNLMGSEKEVSNLINSLGFQIYPAKHYIYHGITKQLNDHCNKRWNRHRATLKHVYFKHPWAAISVTAACILLFLTAVQVVTGILAVPGVIS